MKLFSHLACALSLLSFASAGADSGQWPQFRGPNGSGVASSTGYPAQFSPSKNVVWKQAIPFGQSSPVIADGRLYLTAAGDAQLLTLCFDAKTGRELWRREIPRELAQKIFQANDPASPTPTADARGVVSFFPDFGLAAYSPDGKELWTLPLGPFKNFYGMAASPILAGDLLVLVCDQQSGSFMIGVDRNTGRQRWKTDRAGATIGWATPMVFRPKAGPPQIIVLGSSRLESYYLETGEPRWWMPIGTMGSLGVPVADGDRLLVSTLSSTEPWMPAFADVIAKYDKDKDGRLSKQEFLADKELGEHFGWLDTDSDGIVTSGEWNVAREYGLGEYGAIALKPDGAQGQLSSGAVLWRFKKNLPYIPAPLVYNGVYYMVRSGGIITSLNPANGELLKQGRTRDALGEYYASPVAAGDMVFLSSLEGKITVLKAAAKWETISVNDLDEEIHATPALSDGRIYVRTRGSLYCFGEAR